MITEKLPSYWEQGRYFVLSVANQKTYYADSENEAKFVKDFMVNIMKAPCTCETINPNSYIIIEVMP